MKTLTYIKYTLIYIVAMPLAILVSVITELFGFETKKRLIWDAAKKLDIYVEEFVSDYDFATFVLKVSENRKMNVWIRKRYFGYRVIDNYGRCLNHCLHIKVLDEMTKK